MGKSMKGDTKKMPKDKLEKEIRAKSKEYAIGLDIASKLFHTIATADKKTSVEDLNVRFSGISEGVAQLNSDISDKAWDFAKQMFK